MKVRMNLAITRAALLALLGSWTLVAGTARASIIRNFDSVPSGDTVLTGGVLSGPGAPGSPSSQFNNTASPGFGSASASTGAYNGAYQINGANLVSELGSSLTDFTLVYAYKPDSPNLPNGNSLLVRQLRMFDYSTSVTLEVRMVNQRPNLYLNNIAISGPAIGNTNFSNRLMDGDPGTTVNAPPSTGSGGTAGANTEWVFYAATYHAVTATQVQVSEYGMTESQLSSGLRNYTNGLSPNPVTNSTLGLTNVAFLELGNATFGGGNNRPYDGSFDSFGFYPSVLTETEIAALGTSALTVVPEPASWLLCSLGLCGWQVIARRVRSQRIAN